MRNGLDRLGTLTYAPEHLPETRAEVWKDVDRFRRRLFAALGRAVPLVAVIEVGEESGRLHVHIVYGEYLRKGVVAAAWGRGFVDLRKVKVKGEGQRERCRRAAGYVSKYVLKGQDDGTVREFNARRYSTTHGFRCVKRSRAVESRAHGIWQAQIWCGGQVVWFWDSADADDWLGPPVLSLRFGDGPSPEMYRE